MKRPYQFKAQCLICDYVGTVLHNSKEDYQEVNVCPKCKGAFVDVWKINKHQSKTNEIEIIMSSTNEPPKVKLNGEAIDGIIELGYEFVTKDHESYGHHNFTVKYVDKKTNTVRTVSANKMVEGRLEGSEFL